MKQNEILNHIYIGKENAVTRKELVIRTGLTDRQVRDAIAEARKEVVIINTQDGKGYYISNDINEIKRYIRQEESRAKNIYVSLKAARKMVKGESQVIS